MNDPQRCVVLVPVAQHIEPACEAGLRELERRGYTVRRCHGYAAIDQGRSQMASDALADRFAETMWIDADIDFRPDDVELLRSHNRPISCGIYAKKGMRALAVHVLPGTSKLIFGAGGGLVEIRYAATGFLHVRREVYTAIHQKLELPVCNSWFGRPTIPFFLPMLLPTERGPWYLGEDYAFCERAQQCGIPIVADTRIRLGHIGNYAFHWEEAGTERQRYATFHYTLSDFGPDTDGTQPAEPPIFRSRPEKSSP